MDQCSLKLLDENKLIKKSWSEEQKNLAVNVFMNNNEQINLACINIDEIIQDLFIISSMTAQKKETDSFIYLMNHFKIDTNYANRHGDTCLTMACFCNQNLGFIKYLINDLKMDINHKTKAKYTCLMEALHNNTNLDIIKYLIESNGMNTNHLNHAGDNYLLIACEYNRNLDIIKYLINEKGMDTNYKNKIGENCLMLTLYNKNEEIMKYLINCIGMDAHCQNNNGVNNLMISCRNHPDTGIIKYLINCIGLNVTNEDVLGYNCLAYATCNANVEISKYLCEDIKMNVNHLNKKGLNCLAKAFDLSNTDVILYLINCTEITIQPHNISLEKYECILPGIYKYQRVNQLLTLGIFIFGKYTIGKMCKLINPLLINNDNRQKLSQPDPFEGHFNKFIEFVDKLQCRIPFEEDEIPVRLNVNINKKKRKHSEQCDFSDPPEPIFIHNGTTYYGNKSIVHDAIIMVRKMRKMININDQEPFVLEGRLPKQIINQYIYSCYSGKIDFDTIDQGYFVEFLKFIDQYPTIWLSIDKLEKQIIEYVINRGINDQRELDYLKEISKKYQLKTIYLHINNQKF